MGRNKLMLMTIPMLVVLLGLVVYQYGYARVQKELTSIKEFQFIKTKTLQKYMTLISEKPQIEKELAVVKEERKSEDSDMIEGQTLSIAAATLQETIKGVILGKGGTISSERVGKPADYGKFKIISVSMDTVLPDSRALEEILYSIETRVPYLVVKEMDVRVRNFMNPKELVVRFDIAALTAISAGKI